MRILISNLLIGLLLFSFSVKSQNSNLETLKLEATDVYLVKLNFDSLLYESKCKCAFNKNLDKNYKLYRTTIKELIHMADTSLFNETQLLQVRNVLVHNSINIEMNKTYTVSLYNSSTEKYLFLHRILTLDDSKEYKFKYHAVITGLLKCKKKDKFLKYINEN